MSPLNGCDPFEAFLKSPPLTLSGDDYCLPGCLPAAIPVFKKSERDAQALRNIQKSLGSSAEATLIFIGIEHLAFILSEPDLKQRKIILIEKNKSWFEMHAGDSKEALGAYPDLVVLHGELGLSLSHLIKPVVMEHDMQLLELGSLLLQLLALPAAYFISISLFLVESSPLEQKSNGAIALLVYFLHLLQVRLARRTITTRASSSAKPLVLVNVRGEAEAKLNALYGSVLQPSDYMSFCFEDALSLSAFHHEAPLENVEAIFNRYLAVLDKLLDYHEANQLSALVMRNCMGFASPEMTAIVLAVAKRYGLPLHYFHSDWFTYYTRGYLGGWVWSALLAFGDKLDVVQRHFTMYPTHAALHQTSSCNFYFFPYHYGLDKVSLRSPLPLSEIERDVAIIHYMRFAAAKDLMTELSDVLLELNKGDAAFFFYTLLLRMRQRYRDCYSAEYIKLDVALNNLEWNFYDRIKFERIKKLLPQLIGAHVTLFGPTMSTLFPQAETVDRELGAEELGRIYRTSLLTLDLKGMHSVSHAATVNVVDCLHAGGFPLLMEPPFTSAGGACLPFARQECIPHFKDGAELLRRIEAFKANMFARNDFISAAQQTWMQGLFNAETTPVDVLLKKPIDSINLVLSPTGDERLDDYLVAVVDGYLLLGFGFLEKAVTCWLHAIRSYYCSAQLLSVCLRIAQSLRHHSLVQEIQAMIRSQKSE